MERLDKVKPAFLKRALGLHVSCRNRLVYLLADTPLFVEDLKTRFNLPATTAYDEFIKNWEIKMASIDPEFFMVGAMKDDHTWKKVARTNRHTITRFTVHGFHHVLCSTTGYHEPQPSCICSRCGEHCTT